MSFKDIMPDRDASVDLLDLSVVNTVLLETVFSQAYSSSHHLDSPAYLQ